MTLIEIAGRRIGPGQPCFVIAEAGVNHNGSTALALRLVDAAAEAGADAVKFQTWITEKLVAADAPLAAYQRQNIGAAQSQFEMLKALELSQDAFREIKSYAERRGILFLSTPDEEDSADFLHALGVPLFKIGSAEIDNLPFIAHVAHLGRPMILSTGLAWLSEVERAVRTVRDAGHAPLALLHCVSDYPASPADCNLRAMSTMAAAFGCPIGFSDHTIGLSVACAAVASGACIIEKHLTLDTEMAGPDHRLSLNPEGFRAFVTALREVEAALGDGRKEPVAAEEATRVAVRKVAVASRPLDAGETLVAGDFLLRRASGGVPLAASSRLVGRRMKVALAADSPIAWTDLE